MSIRWPMQEDQIRPSTNACCHQTHLSLSSSSVVMRSPVDANSTTEELLPYVGNSNAVPAGESFGFPVRAKATM